MPAPAGPVLGLPHSVAQPHKDAMHACLECLKDLATIFQHPRHLWPEMALPVFGQDRRTAAREPLLGFWVRVLG